MGEVVWNYSRNIDSDDGYLQLSGRGGACCLGMRGGAVSGLPTHSAGRGRGTHDLVSIRPVAIPSLRPPNEKRPPNF